LSKRILGRGKIANPQKGDILPINHNIQSTTVFLVDDETNFKGEMLLAKAIALAESRNLDLVVIAKDQDPPVCCIKDYSQFRYKTNQQKQKNKKASKSLPLKQIQLTPTIEIHDYEVRRRSAQKFLTAGHKVRVTMAFKGRSLDIQDEVGIEKINQFSKDLQDCSKMDSDPKIERKTLVMMLSPLAIKAK
jgi:translation initiation factor IF-3